MTDRTWFSRLLHLAKKWSRCILTTLKPARGIVNEELYISVTFHSQHYNTMNT